MDLLDIVWCMFTACQARHKIMIVDLARCGLVQEKPTAGNELLKLDLHVALPAYIALSEGGISLRAEFRDGTSAADNRHNRRQAKHVLKIVQGMLNLIGIIDHKSCARRQMAAYNQKLKLAKNRKANTPKPPPAARQLFRFPRVTPKVRMLRQFYGPKSRNKSDPMKAFLLQFHRKIHKIAHSKPFSKGSWNGVFQIPEFVV